MLLTPSTTASAAVASEGEHEFTMDEVDIIQNYLISKAGEHTDVILGLGYDHALGAQIGITLIATGFEHKDPFTKKESVKQEAKNDEKILMTLGVNDEEKKLDNQPALQQELQPSLIEVNADSPTSIIMFANDDRHINAGGKMVDKSEAAEKIQLLFSPDSDIPQQNILFLT